MRVAIYQNLTQFKIPMEPPAWKERVPRWYQLDGPAFTLSELFFNANCPFDHLVLACPGASNRTDLDFVQSGASRAQKFVHTLPNIRASMALQAMNRVCDFTCLQKGSETIMAGFEEFLQLRNEGVLGAFATLYPLDIDENQQNLQTYQSILVSADQSGDWLVSQAENPVDDTSDRAWQHQWSKPTESCRLGKWTLEKIK